MPNRTFAAVCVWSHWRAFIDSLKENLLVGSVWLQTIGEATVVFLLLLDKEDTNIDSSMIGPSTESRRKTDGSGGRQSVWWRTVPDAMHFRVGGNAAAVGIGGDAADKTRQTGSTYNNELVEFVSNISLHCYRWMVEPTFSGWEKYIFRITKDAILVFTDYLQSHMDVGTRMRDVGECNYFDHSVYEIQYTAHGDDTV